MHTHTESTISRPHTYVAQKYNNTCYINGLDIFVARLSSYSQRRK